MFDHKQLEVWRRSHALSVAVDRALERRTKRGPAGLASQLSRACASIAANIAEFAGQNSPTQSARFLDIAIGSASETENHLARAGDLEVIPLNVAARFSAEVCEVRSMTVAFRKWVLRDPSW